ncbi:MAG: DUF433 domain-containing protein [Ignavibacteriae bacterium]|nr:DUF433 domain-containing protein [Ignavibacteriota bacterium]
MQTDTLDKHIEITPGVCGGKPRIAGHRITVHNIVIWHDALGMSADEIASEYDIPLLGVYAALAYYYDHKTEIDERAKRDDEFVEAMRNATPSLVEKKLRERFGEAVHG